MDNYGFQTNAQVTQKPPNLFKAFVYDNPSYGAYHG